MSAIILIRHLEDCLPGMAHDLRPNLDQFLPQRRQHPVTRRWGQHRLPQEVAQIEDQHEQLPCGASAAKAACGPVQRDKDWRLECRSGR